MYRLQVDPAAVDCYGGENGPRRCIPRVSRAGHRPVTPFFIPGVSEQGHGLERAYRNMCVEIELELGSRPSSRRIFKLWARRGAVDCLTEVGCRDPVRGGTVIAIFDLGSHQPFVVWRQPDGPATPGVREVLRANAYSTEEFDPVNPR